LKPFGNERMQAHWAALLIPEKPCNHVLPTAACRPEERWIHMIGMAETAGLPKGTRRPRDRSDSSQAHSVSGQPIPSRPSPGRTVLHRVRRPVRSDRTRQSAVARSVPWANQQNLAVVRLQRHSLLMMGSAMPQMYRKNGQRYPGCDGILKMAPGR
jgi:hypothetical protein